MACVFVVAAAAREGWVEDGGCVGWLGIGWMRTI